MTDDMSSDARRQHELLLEELRSMILRIVGTFPDGITSDDAMGYIQVPLDKAKSYIEAWPEAVESLLSSERLRKTDDQRLVHPEDRRPINPKEVMPELFHLFVRAPIPQLNGAETMRRHDEAIHIHGAFFKKKKFTRGDVVQETDGTWDVIVLRGASVSHVESVLTETLGLEIVRRASHSELGIEEPYIIWFCDVCKKVSRALFEPENPMSVIFEPAKDHRDISPNCDASGLSVHKVDPKDVDWDAVPSWARASVARLVQGSDP